MRLAPPRSAAGTSFQEIFSFLQTRTRETYTLPLSECNVDDSTAELVIGSSRYKMTPHAAGQLASLVGVPKTYALKISNELASINLNTFLNNEPQSAQVIIEDDDTITGFLRAKTTPIETQFMVETVSDTMERDGLSLSKWFYTDAQGLTLRMTSDRMTFEPKVGDIVQAGVDFTNRENSDKGLGLSGVCFRLICSNGAVRQESKDLLRSASREQWREPSARLQLMTAFALDEMRDMLGVADNLKRMSDMALALPEDIDERIEYLTTGLRAIRPQRISNKTTTESVLDMVLIESDNPSFYDLYNALTRMGRDAMDPKQRTLFEGAGYSLSLDPDRVLEAMVS